MFVHLLGRGDSPVEHAAGLFHGRVVAGGHQEQRRPEVQSIAVVVGHDLGGLLAEQVGLPAVERPGVAVVQRAAEVHVHVDQLLVADDVERDDALFLRALAARQGVAELRPGVHGVGEQLAVGADDGVADLEMPLGGGLGHDLENGELRMAPSSRTCAPVMPSGITGQLRELPLPFMTLSRNSPAREITRAWSASLRFSVRGQLACGRGIGRARYCMAAYSAGLGSSPSTLDWRQVHVRPRVPNGVESILDGARPGDRGDAQRSDESDDLYFGLSHLQILNLLPAVWYSACLPSVSTPSWILDRPGRRLRRFFGPRLILT